MADHCRTYALSDLKDESFKKECTHDHDQLCGPCEQTKHAIQEVKTLVNKTDFKGRNDEDDVKFRLQNAESGISRWKAHILRAKNQEIAKQDVFGNISESGCLIVTDWAMKFLPRKFREDTKDWFGKRGLSWHISVVFKKVQSKVQSLTYIHIFEKPISQDASVATAIILDVVASLQHQFPEIQKVHMWSDNAGCYKSAETICSIFHHCKIVKSYDFCESQDGKGACDRTAATIKCGIRQYVNEGHDVITAHHMKEVILNSI